MSCRSCQQTIMQTYFQNYTKKAISQQAAEPHEECSRLHSFFSSSTKLPSYGALKYPKIKIVKPRHKNCYACYKNQWKLLKKWFQYLFFARKPCVQIIWNLDCKSCRIHNFMRFLHVQAMYKPRVVLPIRFPSREPRAHFQSIFCCSCFLNNF